MDHSIPTVAQRLSAAEALGRAALSVIGGDARRFDVSVSMGRALDPLCLELRAIDTACTVTFAFSLNVPMSQVAERVQDAVHLLTTRSAAPMNAQAAVA